MLVEPTNRGTSLLHHIGNADALKTELAKPLGSDLHDPSVRLRLVTLRITHFGLTLSSRVRMDRSNVPGIRREFLEGALSRPDSGAPGPSRGTPGECDRPRES